MGKSPPDGTVLSKVMLVGWSGWIWKVEMVLDPALTTKRQPPPTTTLSWLKRPSLAPGVLVPPFPPVCTTDENLTVPSDCME